MLTFSVSAVQRFDDNSCSADFFCFYRSADRYFLYTGSIVLQYLSVVGICGTDGRM